MNALEPLINALEEVSKQLKTLNFQLSDLLSKVEEDSLEQDETDDEPY